MQVWPAIAVDVICILVFAIVGRSSHNEATDLLGIVHTTWPFLIGAGAGMVAGRIWRRPTAVATGVFVWLGALIIGMALRFVSGGGVQLSFVDRRRLRARRVPDRLASRPQADPPGRPQLRRLKPDRPYRLTGTGRCSTPCRSTVRAGCPAWS